MHTNRHAQTHWTSKGQALSARAAKLMPLSFTLAAYNMPRVARTATQNTTTLNCMSHLPTPFSLR